MVGEDEVGVAAGPGGLGHLPRSSGSRPTSRSGRGVAPQVGDLDEGRQPAVPRGLDLARVLAQLRRHLGQVEEPVHLGLGGEGPQLGRGPGRDLALVVEAGEALLRQAPAAVAGDPAEADVVLLAAGEVDEVRPGLARRHRHEVDLRPAGQPHGGLVWPGPDDGLDRGQSREAGDDGRRVVGLDEQVEVADGLAAATEGTGGHDRADARRVGERRHQAVDEPLRRAERQARRSAVDHLEPRPQARDPLLRQPGDGPQRPRPQRGAEVVEALDAEALPEEPDGLRPDTRDRQELDERRRQLAVETLEEAKPPGRRELGDLVGDRLADAGDRRRPARAIGRGDAVRVALDRVGRAVVGDRLEDEVATDLEEAPDLVERRRQLGVRGRRRQGGVRRGVAGRRPGRARGGLLGHRGGVSHGRPGATVARRFGPD